MAVQGSKSRYEEDRSAAAVPERANGEKIEKTYHPNYKKDNVRQIRRYLGLSQQDFLDRFMRGEAPHERSIPFEPGIQGRRDAQ